MEPEIKFDYNAWKKKVAAFDHEKFDRKMAEANSADTIEEYGRILLGGDAPPFKPHAHHNIYGDQLEVYLSDEETFGHWLCPGIVALCSQETGKVVGIIVEGISHVMKPEAPKE